MSGKSSTQCGVQTFQGNMSAKANSMAEPRWWAIGLGLPRTSFPVHISLGFLCVWRLPLRPLERLTCAEQRVSVLAVSTALSYYSDAYTAADGVPEGFSDEDLVMALLRGAPLAPSRPLVATTFMFQRKEGEVLIAHGALNCVSPEARQDEEAQKADIFLLISVAKS